MKINIWKKKIVFSYKRWRNENKRWKNEKSFSSINVDEVSNGKMKMDLCWHERK
jgi:hypothetical protein